MPPPGGLPRAPLGAEAALAGEDDDVGVPNPRCLKSSFARGLQSQRQGGDEASKTARLRRVADEEFAVNDEELDAPIEWTDASVLPFLETGPSAVVETAKVGSDVQCSSNDSTEVQGAMSKAELQLLEERLWFPEEPSLSEADRAEVDGIADLFEVHRLER